MNQKIALDKSTLLNYDSEIREALTFEGTIFEAMKIARVGASTEAVEELIKAAINYGQAQYASEAAKINNRTLTTEEIDLMIESAINKGRNAYAIDAAILGPSSETLQKLITHISSNKHIWIIHELEKLVARKESPKYNGKKLDDPEKDFYCSIIEKVKNYAQTQTQKTTQKSEQCKKQNRFTVFIKSIFKKQK